MSPSWNDKIPIYRQLHDILLDMMLDGLLPEGSALPSVRQIATDYQVNPLTVLKACQDLVDEGLVEKRRGIGMFVAAGALTRLHHQEKERFFREEWPATLRTIRRLNLKIEDLLQNGHQSDDMH